MTTPKDEMMTTNEAERAAARKRQARLLIAAIAVLTLAACLAAIWYTI